MLFLALGLGFLRVHPRHFDFSRLLLVQFLLQLNQPYVVPERRLCVFPFQFLLHVFQQAFDYSRLRCLRLRSLFLPVRCIFFSLVVVAAIRAFPLRQKNSIGQRHLRPAFSPQVCELWMVIFRGVPVTAPKSAYRTAGLACAAGAGFANFAASTATLGCTSVRSMVDCPSVHVATQWKGILTPATSR